MTSSSRHPDAKLLAEIRLLRSELALQSAQIDALTDLLQCMAIATNDNLPGVVAALVDLANAKQRFASDACREIQATSIESFTTELVAFYDMPVND